MIGLVALLFCGPALAQTTWHVDVVNCLCPGCGDGSIGNPFCVIQQAINASANGDEIIVQPGTYLGSINFLGKAIIVRSTDPNDPAVVASTILEGTGSSGSVVTFNSGETAMSVLSGVTIRNGVAIQGGAVFIKNSSPTIENSVLTLNTATFGGAVYNEGGDPTCSGSTFWANSAGTHGGAIYNVALSSLTIVDCGFYSNSADQGGAIYSDNSFLSINQCVFSGNIADIGAGVSVISGSDMTMTNCTFSRNAATTNGGALHFSIFSDATVTNCILWEDSPNEIYDQTNNTPENVSFSDIQGEHPGTANIASSPAFVDPDGPDNVVGTPDDDLRLNNHSPGIDSGHNDSAIVSGLTLDFNSDTRFVDDAAVTDSGNGTAPIVDMGAYERQVDSLAQSIKVTTLDSIQDTIDAAGYTDEIILNPGVYNQVIDLRGKALTIRGEDPNDPAVVAATVLDGTGLNDSVITMHSGVGPVVISGLTITGGVAENRGGGIDIEGDSYKSVAFVILNCTISDNAVTQNNLGGGIYLFNSTGTIDRCTISDNVIPGNGGGVFVGNSDVTLIDSVIADNTARRGGGLSTGSFNGLINYLTVKGCAFNRNIAERGGGMSGCLCRAHQQ